MQRLAYIRGIAVAAAVAGWRASRSLLPLLRELVSLPDTAVRQALASQLTPMGEEARIITTPYLKRQRVNAHHDLPVDKQISGHTQSA